jgi:hypothetical protein
MHQACTLSFGLNELARGLESSPMPCDIDACQPAKVMCSPLAQSSFVCAAPQNVIAGAGEAIHKEHHEQPYHHVSLDPPGLVIGVMLLASGVFAVLLGPASPLWLTATAAYWSAGEQQRVCFVAGTRQR